MLVLETVAKIRRTYFVQKKTIKAICRGLRDLLLVDDDPLADIRLIEDPARNCVVVMKDGTIRKQTI